MMYSAFNHVCQVGLDFLHKESFHQQWFHVVSSTLPGIFMENG